MAQTLKLRTCDNLKEMKRLSNIEDARARQERGEDTCLLVIMLDGPWSRGIQT